MKAALTGMIAQGPGIVYNMEGFGSRGSRKLVGLSLYGSTKAAIAFLTNLADRRGERQTGLRRLYSTGHGGDGPAPQPTQRQRRGLGTFETRFQYFSGQSRNDRAVDCRPGSGEQRKRQAYPLAERWQGLFPLLNRSTYKTTCHRLNGLAIFRSLMTNRGGIWNTAF